MKIEVEPNQDFFKKKDETLAVKVFNKEILSISSAKQLKKMLTQVCRQTKQIIYTASVHSHFHVEVLSLRNATMRSNKSEKC